MQMEAPLQKRKKQTQTKTKTELPEDIIHDEILTRLPHESLLRFRCVCKPWRILFSHPEFNKIHLSRRRQCCDQDYLVQTYNKINGFGLENYLDQDYYLVSNTKMYTSELTIISRSKETRINTPTFISSNSLLLGSVNGLICFARPDVFTLWNPAIRQYKELSTAHLHCSIGKESADCDNRRFFDGKCRHLSGFGWDPLENDYKMVLVCYVRPDLRRASVYSCNNDSWTQFVLPAGIFNTNSTPFAKSSRPAIIVKECPYWSCSKYLTLPGNSYKRRCAAVFKFVAETNEFKLLPDFDLATNQELKLINLKDSLVGMLYKGTHPYNKWSVRFMKIYSLDHEGSAGVWSMMYTLGASDYGFLYRRISLELEFEHEDRKLGQLVLYDPETNEIQDEVDGTPFENGRFVHTPSLVFVHGMKTVTDSET